MPIESTDGGIVATGKGINTFRLLALKGAVNLESKGLTRRGRSAKSIACAELGLPARTKHAEVIAALQAAADASNAADRADSAQQEVSA